MKLSTLLCLEFNRFSVALFLLVSASALQFCFIKCITYMYCGVIFAIALRLAIKFIDCSTDLKLQLWVLDT